MAHTKTVDKQEEAHAGHGTGRYWLVWGALICFTFLTVVTGKTNLGAANIYIAMGIATTKASLVVLFFMHLYDAGKVNRLVFVVSVFFVLVLMIGIFGDLIARLPSSLPGGGPAAHRDVVGKTVGAHEGAERE